MLINRRNKLIFSVSVFKNIKYKAVVRFLIARRIFTFHILKRLRTSYVKYRYSISASQNVCIHYFLLLCKNTCGYFLILINLVILFCVVVVVVIFLSSVYNTLPSTCVWTFLHNKIKRIIMVWLPGIFYNIYHPVASKVVAILWVVRHKDLFLDWPMVAV